MCRDASIWVHFDDINEVGSPRTAETGVRCWLASEKHCTASISM
jgi:hypothetical protein